MLRELDELYSAALAGRQTTLPPPALNYCDYVQWQANLLSGKDGERLAAYWRRMLDQPRSSVDLLRSPLRPPIRSFTGGSHSTTIAQSDVNNLRALAERSGTTLFMVLLALPWIDYFPSNWLLAAIALNALILYLLLAVLSFLFSLFRPSRT